MPDQQAAALAARRPVAVQRHSCALLGIWAEQAQGFLPEVMEFFKSKLSDPVVKQISDLSPTPQETPA